VAVSGQTIATSLAWALSLSPTAALAHPGNTDSSGCHTCRTNCPSWGLSYGEYHCHNSKGVEQPSYPIHSVYGSGGTGYTVPAPDYAATPSCPSMSSYSSLSGSCECYAGRIVKQDHSRTYPHAITSTPWYP
jgi:hypothetical protein